MTLVFLGQHQVPQVRRRRRRARAGRPRPRTRRIDPVPRSTCRPAPRPGSACRRCRCRRCSPRRRRPLTASRPDRCRRCGRPAAPGRRLIATVGVASGPAWRRTLVSDSCTMRYAARSTSGGSDRGAPSTVVRAGSISVSMFARLGWGARGARSSFGRSTPSTERTSPSASALAALIASRAARAWSGCSPIRCSPTPACTLINDRWWPSTSCSSWAMRSRSSLACRRSCSSRARACSIMVRRISPKCAARTRTASAIASASTNQTATCTDVRIPGWRSVKVPTCGMSRVGTSAPETEEDGVRGGETAPDGDAVPGAYGSEDRDQERQKHRAIRVPQHHVRRSWRRG